MANYETIIYEKVEDKIFRLTLNRPEKLNALSQKLLAEFESVMSEYESDPEASVLIIRGAGRAFSAGYDLQGTQHPGSKFTVTSDRYGLHKTIERWQRLWTINKPTIAQVHGFCLAGGTELDRPLRYRVRQRGRAVRASGRALARNPADALDVAGADGSAQDQGVLLHRRLHVGEGSARVASRQSRLSEGQARGGDARLLRAASRWCRRSC